jgi:hypothetical protein
MIVKFYSAGPQSGYAGWLETLSGHLLGFLPEGGGAVLWMGEPKPDA